ncbi:hypothetical protein PP740_gp070 [Stenotrophomonas phage Philippe]|uniref:Uncharacterized protein n=1 Tax=Stenotrophomonas phage Philippe TaxID=2859655 RepID=A0AAE7WMM4_9CAUD|nr:hypothetical protein PP740_gp070 [Stenotrophomonas phage Philippe]QYW02272.1 hypothetical protein CPT_Philippe_079 [Stenotrophomonas phage Philippe]
MDYNNWLAQYPALGQGFQAAGSGGIGGYPTGAGVSINQNWQQGYRPYGAGMGQNSGFGLNMNTFQTGLGAVQGLSNLYFGFRGLNMAKDQFNLSKRVAEANLNNTRQSYNTQLEDRARSRAVMEGQTAQQTQDYIDRNRLGG